MAVRVHHTALGVSNLKRAEDFYARHFDFRRVKTFNAGKANEFCMLESGVTILELFNVPDAGSDRTEYSKVGFRHLALQVDDVNSHYERLKDEVEFSVTPRDADVFRVAFFKDPDGIIVELIEEKDSRFRRNG